VNLIETYIKGFGCIGEARLQLANQGLVYVIGENHDTNAADSNGSGKTTLFKAICWCLYGETIDGDKGDEVIKLGEKEALVEVSASDNKGDIWTISRSRKKGKPGLALKDVSGAPIQLDKDELQRRIITMIGLDFQAFKNSVLYGQNDSHRFAHPKTNDSQRKSMLHKILRTEVLQKCHEVAKEKRLRIKKQAEGIEKDIETIKAKRDEHDLSTLKNDAKEWEENREKRVAHQREKAQSALEQAKHNQGRAGELDGLTEQMFELEKQINEAEAAQKAADALDTDIDKIAESERGWLIDRGNASAGIRQCVEHLEQLAGEQCPVCANPLSGKKAKEHIASIKVQKQNAEKRVDDVDKKVEELKAKRGALEKKQSALREKARQAKGLYNQKTNLKAKIMTVENLAKRVNELKAEVKEAMADMKKAMDEKNPYQERLEIAQKKVDKYNKKITQLKMDFAEKNEEAAHIQFWVKGFSNQGLPSYILDSVMPFITERANHYLEILADGDITMEFKTQRELKSQAGQVRDEIDIRWTIEGNEDVTPSGGQQKKMEIATDLALMDLVASQESGHIDLLIMDEVLDGLDREGRNRVMLLLQEIRARRNTIFVISHESDLAEMFEKQVKAIKHDGDTSVERMAA